jgi:hypothetical protein
VKRTSLQKGAENPTNAVGGSFIRGLQTKLRLGLKSHQRSWWIIHTQPNCPREFVIQLSRERPDMNNPPTALVGFGSLCDISRRSRMNDPPTALVGLNPKAFVMILSAAER